MSLLRSSVVSLVSLSMLAGCAADAPKATAGGEVASASTAAVPTSTPVSAATPPDSTAPVTGAATTAVVDGPLAEPAPGDTVTPRLRPGRSKTDGTSFATAIRAGIRKEASWPKSPAPLPGALLPANRIIAYYGNPHSKKMGVIGEYPEQQMLGMLDRTVAAWKAAEPKTPIIPAIHLVAVVAQGAPGADNKWRRRENAQMIEKTYGWAKSKKGVLFLDIQASHSTLQEELPPLLTYLSRPDVHLGLDPEFYMHHDKEGVRPSAKIGTMKAADINYVIRTLDKLVAEKNLPPKVLVVHRFTAKMVPDAEGIRPTPRVQVVIHMDGWGPPWLKFDSYHHYVVNHPVQFTGFKLFYHNDTKKGDALLTPSELVQLRPRLNYIQYQ
jgi:hypothetical protein